MGEPSTIAIGGDARTTLAARLRRTGFRRDDRGVAVVEFSLVALPLFVLIAVILEAAFVVFAQHRLDVSVERAARILRTGAFQSAATGEDPTTRLRTAMCG